MPIVKSEIVSATTQVNGQILVHERHSDHHGRLLDHQYFAPADWDINVVMQQRAVNMGADIDKREAQQAEATNYEVPLTWYEFMDRFTDVERKKIRARTQSNETVADFIDLGKARGVIYRSSPRVSAALDALIALNDLAPNRKAEVLA